MKKTAFAVMFRLSQTMRRAASRTLSLGAILIALFAVTENAHAICVINSFYDTSASYGAAVDVRHFGCANNIVGGGGFTSASDSNVYGDASANLNSGVLTALALGNGYASSILWDTFTFNGLPAGGAMLTEMVALVGSITGDATGAVRLWQDDGDTTSYFQFSSDSGVPASVSYSFLAQNGTATKLGIELLAYGNAYGNPGIADLLDPPTFSILVPDGITYASASGQFANVFPPSVNAVPEPAPYALLLLGLVAMGVSPSRRSRRL